MYYENNEIIQRGKDYSINSKIKNKIKLGIWISNFIFFFTLPPSFIILYINIEQNMYIIWWRGVVGYHVNLTL